NENNNTASQPLIVQQGADTAAPSVRVTSPKSGDLVAPGGNLQIVFVSTDNVGVVSQDIDLSVDGGATFPTSIARNLAGTVQQFVFSVPQNFSPSTQAVVRVTARDAAGNSGTGLSDKFTIGDIVPPTVKITAPAGGETLTAGTVFNIVFS